METVAFKADPLKYDDTLYITLSILLYVIIFIV